MTAPLGPSWIKTALYTYRNLSLKGISSTITKSPTLKLHTSGKGRPCPIPTCPLCCLRHPEATSAVTSAQHKATQPLQGWSSSSLPHHFCNHAVSQIKGRSSNQNKSRLSSSITTLNMLPLLCVRVKFLELSTQKLFCSPILSTGKFANTNFSESKPL